MLEPTWKKSNTDKLLPSREYPSTLKRSPKRISDRIDIELPKRDAPVTDIALDNRAKLRNDSELPRWRKSSTLSANTEPTRARPWSEKTEPTAAKDRRLRDDPRWR